MLRRADENSCSNSSAGYDSKNSRVSRPAFPRPAAGACGIRLQLPDGLVLNLGAITPRETCVSATPDIALNPPPTRKSCLKSSAHPACPLESVYIIGTYATSIIGPPRLK